jgi:hypothetical protein
MTESPIAGQRTTGAEPRATVYFQELLENGTGFRSAHYTTSLASVAESCRRVMERGGRIVRVSRIGGVS